MLLTLRSSSALAWTATSSSRVSGSEQKLGGGSSLVRPLTRGAAAAASGESCLAGERACLFRRPIMRRTGLTPRLLLRVGEALPGSMATPKYCASFSWDPAACCSASPGGAGRAVALSSCCLPLDCSCGAASAGALAGLGCAAGGIVSGAAISVSA